MSEIGPMSWQVLSYGDVLARKEHRCWLCSRVIKAGETYHPSSGVGDDGFDTFKMCAHCQAFVGAYGDDFLWDWHEGYSAEDVREWEPGGGDAEVARQQFLSGWRDQSGELVDRPTLSGKRP